MIHKYKIENNVVIGKIIEHIHRNADLYTVSGAGLNIEFESEHYDIVTIDYPIIRTIGTTSDYVMQLILSNCSEIHETVQWSITKRELILLEFLLKGHNITAITHTKKPLLSKINILKYMFQR